MIALDTNVLVRFLAQDDPVQARIAAEIIEGAADRDESLFLSDVVIAETAWVLTRAYKVTRKALADILLRLADARHIEMRDDDIVRRAATAFAAGRGDFADYFIRELSLESGCDQVVTFDRALWREGFARAAG
ncbi:MAG: type II toxin-antitoxin system VapC family toxin [Gemmatimonadaceae bacterium]